MAPGNSWREEQLRKQSDEREYSNSNYTWKFMLGYFKTRVPEHETHEPSIHEQDLSVSAKEIHDATIPNASMQNKCIDMGNVHVFADESSHPSWAELLDEFGDLQEHEL